MTQVQEIQHTFLSTLHNKEGLFILRTPKLYRVKPYNIPDDAESFRQQDDIHS